MWIHVVGIGAYLAANASFRGWHSGVSVGSRYLICALPQFGLGLALLPWSRLTRCIAGALSAVSMLNMLAIAAVNPLAPLPHPSPLYEHTYNLFLKGLLSPWTFVVRRLDVYPGWTPLKPFAMWNWGQRLWLEGLVSLVPLACMLALGALWLRHELRVARAHAAAQDSRTSTARAALVGGVGPSDGHSRAPSHAQHCLDDA